MRRKSEKNKGKSPEPAPKLERPKRGRPSRRRKKSSSSEKNSESDHGSQDVPEPQPTPVPNTDRRKSGEGICDDDSVPVWQVKKSESSGDSGEIQKLKICLARPPSTPERPDRSPRAKKRSGHSSVDTLSDTVEEKRRTRHKSRRNSGKDTAIEDTTSETDDLSEISTKQSETENFSEKEQIEEPIEKSNKEIESQAVDEKLKSPVQKEDAKLKSPVQKEDEKLKSPAQKEDEKLKSPVQKEDEKIKSPVQKEELEEKSTMAVELEISQPSSDTRENINEEKIESIEKNDITKVEEINVSNENETKEPVEVISEVNPEIEITVQPQELPKENENIVNINEERKDCDEMKMDVDADSQQKGKCEDLPNSEVAEVVKEDSKVVPEVNNTTEAMETICEENIENKADKPTDAILCQNDEELKEEVVAKSESPKTVVEAVDTEIKEQTTETSFTRKRRWGSRSSKSNKTTTVCISTDSLKSLIPNVEPVSVEDVLLDVKPKADVPVSEPSNEIIKPNGKLEAVEKLKEKEVLRNTTHRKISVVNEDLPREQRSPTPPKHKSSAVLYITNLVRPFTLPQLKNLLLRTGKIVENGFWIDKIKSKCFVQYQNEDEAIETRHALHGVTWPVSNPKTLIVDFSSESAMRSAMESSEDDKLIAPSDFRGKGLNTKENDFKKDNEGFEKRIVIREWDVGKGENKELRDDNINNRLSGHQGYTRDQHDGERNEKRKRRSKSPSPARKFKKKEDEAPSKLLDDLFRKTKATPCIYWLPLNAETILIKEEQRRKHMAEHGRRMEEIRRANEEQRSSRHPTNRHR